MWRDPGLPARSRKTNLSGAQHCGYCMLDQLDKEELVFNIYRNKACNCYCQPASFDPTVF